MTKRIFIAMCTLMLVMQLVPAAAFAQRTDTGDTRVPIEQLLAAGEYAEGEAIESAPHPLMTFSLVVPFAVKAGDIIRK